MTALLSVPFSSVGFFMKPVRNALKPSSALALVFLIVSLTTGCVSYSLSNVRQRHPEQVSAMSENVAVSIVRSCLIGANGASGLAAIPPGKIVFRPSVKADAMDDGDPGFVYEPRGLANHFSVKMDVPEEGFCCFFDFQSPASANERFSKDVFRASSNVPRELF